MLIINDHCPFFKETAANTAQIRHQAAQDVYKRQAVELGIAKVNICTDLLNAARDNTKDGYAERSYYDSVTLAKDGFKDCLKHYYEVFPVSYTHLLK